MNSASRLFLNFFSLFARDAMKCDMHSDTEGLISTQVVRQSVYMPGVGDVIHGTFVS